MEPTNAFHPATLPAVCVVAGHYGVGKTNFAINLALASHAAGRDVRVVDLDVVNPYFRTSDFRSVLEDAGVPVIAPVFAGSTLDVPSLSGEVSSAIAWAQRPGTADARPLLIVDAGGDDVGATALGRYARAIGTASYALLYVVNRSRNLTQDPAEAVRVLREVEAQAHLAATAIVNNTHLKQETDEDVVAAGVPYAAAVARLAGLPLACTVVPQDNAFEVPNGAGALFGVRTYVKTPWE